MSDSPVLVCAPVRISESTEINYHVFERGLVEFSIDGELDLLATERGLRNLVDRAGEALRAVQSAIASDDEGCPTA